MHFRFLCRLILANSDKFETSSCKNCKLSNLKRWKVFTKSDLSFLFQMCRQAHIWPGFMKTLICQQLLDVWINQGERVFISCWWLFETLLRYCPLIFKWLCLEGIIRRNLFGLSIQQGLEESGAFICITYAVTPADLWLLGWQIWNRMVTWGSWVCNAVMCFEDILHVTLEQ